MYPTAIDTGASLPNPGTGNATNSPSHAGLHAAENNAIVALENKLGTGSSTASANQFLFGTGNKVSAWSQITSVQLAAAMSDPTGSGANVFANTPTLITPKVDTINESTVGNGVTAGGVNLKAGVVTTANSVGSTAIAAAAVLAAKLGLSSASTGGVATLANTGTLAGNMYYINLGGIKLLWGQSANTFINANTGPQSTVVFPGGFFSSIQSGFTCANTINTQSQQTTNWLSLTTTGGTIIGYSATTTTAETIGYWVVGT
jgi:hypothetical protein